MVTPGKANRFSTGLLVSFLLFVAWTIGALTPVLAQIDRAITITLQRVAFSPLDIGFSLITILGNAEVTTLLVLVIGIVLIRTGRAPLALVVWALFVGGSALEWVAKHQVPHASVPLELQRRGINTLHYVIRTPYGYPSGHAFRTLLLAAAGWVTWRPRASVARRRLRAALVLVVGLMGLALVYLGDHWMSEVVGGYLLAVLCILVIGAVASLGFVGS